MTLADLNTEINESADYWRFDIGLNTIPSDTKNKTTNTQWSDYQLQPVPEWLHEHWKQDGAFNKGIAIIPGRVWHKDDKQNLYFIFIDADKQIAIDELCTRNGKRIALQEMAQKFLVEQHADNPEKAHIYFYSPIPFPKKSADTELGLEVKGLGEHGIAFCFPSIHKNGYPYEIIGTNQPVVLTIEQAREMIQHIDQICIKHGVQYLEKGQEDFISSVIVGKLREVVKTLVIDTTIRIPQGQRHVTLISIADSILFRHLGKKSEKQLKEFFDKINHLLCEPEPLPDSEINSIWDSALDFVQRTKEESKEKEDGNPISPPKSSAEILVELAMKNIGLLFKDQYGTAYALVHIADHDEIARVESNRFKRYLSKLFYDVNGGKIINAEALTNAIQVIQAKAEYDGNTIPLSLRVAWHDNGIHYDLTDEKWRSIWITNDSWEIINKTPTPLFVRYNQTVQTEPDRDYGSDIVDKFFALTNLKEEQDLTQGIHHFSIYP